MHLKTSNLFIQKANFLTLDDANVELISPVLCS